MLGLVYLALYEIAGCAVANRLFAGRGRQTRLWLGLTLGCGMLMWFPSLFAFAMNFTLGAQLLGVGLALILGGLSLLVPRRARAALPDDAASEPPLRITLGAVIPLVIVMAYMQYTHTLRPEGGALWTGQSTYGDMNLHLGIATGLVNQAYPPDYTILPGTLLGYPFLVDAASASLYMTGMGLRWAFIVPGVLMCALVFWGFLLLAWEMTKSARAALLSYALMFLNGGLGFAYLFDLAGKDPSRLIEAFEGFYKAPANLVANIRIAVPGAGLIELPSFQIEARHVPVIRESLGLGALGVFLDPAHGNCGEAGVLSLKLLHGPPGHPAVGAEIHMQNGQRFHARSPIVKNHGTAARHAV